MVGSVRFGGLVVIFCGWFCGGVLMAAICGWFRFVLAAFYGRFCVFWRVSFHVLWAVLRDGDLRLVGLVFNWHLHSF